jgi:hypothetical protein
MVVAEKPKVVLDPVRHARLLEDLDHICAVANIPQKYVKESMTSHCTAKEVDWVVNFHMHRNVSPGLLLVDRPNVTNACCAIGGALLRNFIDARVMTLTSLLDAASSGDVPTPTVMIIPNMFVSSYGKQLPAFKVAHLYDILLSRATSNLPTVVCVEDIDAMTAAYGLAFADHLKNYRCQQ